MRIAIKTVLGIVLILGLLVGFAHWRLAGQTPQGAWEYDLEGVEGSIRVAADTVLVNDTVGGDGWVAVDRENGKRLAGEVPINVYQAQLGSNGWFAITSGVGVTDQVVTVTVYDDTGRQVWTRDGDSVLAARIIAIADDGFVVITSEDRGDGAPDRARIQKIGPRGEVVWQRPLAQGESGYGVTWGFRGADEELGDWISVPRVPAVTFADKTVRLLDQDGRPTGPAGEVRSSLVVDDVLVTSQLEGEECTFRATNIEGEVWRSSTPCDSAPWLPESIGDLMTVLLKGGESRRISVNLRTGDVGTTPYGRARGFDPEKLGAVAVSDEVAVRQQRSTFTGSDPFTGKKRWSYAGPGRTSNKDDRYPGVDVSGDKVSILSSSEPWWGFFAWGAEVPRSTVTFLDGRTGDELATLRSADLYSMTATSDGDILLLSDGKLRLLRN